jgi:hypothetical protein
MKLRQLGRVGTPLPLGYSRRVVYAPPAPPLPVDYSKRVVYGPGPGVTPIYPEYLPEHRPHISGVYMLTESGRFYIGQSGDVFTRLLSHLSNPACCGFTAPHGVLLASVPFRDDWTLDKNTHMRLIAEARFIAAALSLDVPLTNKLSNYKRGKLLSLFPDITTEREIIKEALRGN